VKCVCVREKEGGRCVRKGVCVCLWGRGSVCVRERRKEHDACVDVCMCL